MRRRRRHLGRALAALAIGVTVGYLGSNVMPVLLAGVGDRLSMSNTALGAIGTSQLLATAVAALSLTDRAGRPGRARVARLGLAIAAVGFAAAVLAPERWTLGAANVFAGIGLGMVGAMALAGLAGQNDRAAAITIFVNVLGVAAMVAVIPLVDSLLGAGRGFGLVAAVCLLAVPVVGRLPDPVAVAGVEHRLPLPHRTAGIVLAVGTGLFAATDIGFWSYAEIIGERHAHLTGAALILTLALGVVSGLIGVVSAASLSTRWRKTGPLAVFLLSGAALKFGLALTTNPLGYGIGIAVWNVTYPAIVLLLLTTGSALDPLGRWNAALGGSLAVGTAIGPLAAGAMLDIGYAALAGCLLVTTLVATALITAVSFRVDRQPAPALSSHTAPVQ